MASLVQTLQIYRSNEQQTTYKVVVNFGVPVETQ
jgi:hypothetical protein